MDASDIESISGVNRPQNIKLELQFMAESSSSDSTSVADTAELGVTGYNVADANRPWSRRVNEMPM